MPDFTWPDRQKPLATSRMPSTPQPTHPWLRRFWGSIHWHLRSFSLRYCRWVEISYDNQIVQLPFGLVLKWSDGTRTEEVLAMQVARAAGFPVPRVICYGEHPESPHAPISILMTRMPGGELGTVSQSLSDDEKEYISRELKTYLGTMRQWANPWDGRICTISGTAIRSVRVPMHCVGPYESEQEFNEYLIGASWAGGFPAEAEYQDARNRAEKIQPTPHPVVFTHGDPKPHNILVDKGRITAFLDWESAGWYPAYWEFTTALRFTFEKSWWYDFVLKLGGDEYLAELDCEKALTSLTSSSYSW